MRYPVRTTAWSLLSGVAIAALVLSCGGGSSSNRGGPPAPLGITTTSLKVAAELLPYSFQIQGTGGAPAYLWEVSAGTLPGGLSLDGATGIISGTPVSGESASSPFVIEIRLTDGIGAVVTRTFDLIVDPPGGFGGGTPTGTITVLVLEEETMQPLQGAFVMIGSAPDVPFTGNFQTTDAAGVAQFTDAALDNPPTPPMVTAGADLRQYLTIVGADASRFILPLKRVANPASMARLDGLITGINPTANNFHAGILIPPVRLSELFNVRLENLFLGEECLCATCDKIILPGNVSFPQQDLFFLPPGDDIFEKTYFMDFEVGTTQHLVATTGFIDSQTLLQFVAGGNPNRIALFTQLQVEGFGIVRDFPITGNATVDVPINIPLGTPVDVSVLRTPRGSDVFVAAAADIDASGGSGQIIASDFGFVARDQTLPQTDTLAAVPDTWPWGVSPTKVALAAAFYDPFSGILPLPPANLENAFSLMADRTTSFSTPGGIQLESFFDLMPLDLNNIGGGNRTFTYPTVLDPNNPTSPIPDFTLSQISRSWLVVPPPLADPFPGQHCPPTSGIADCDEAFPTPPVCPLPSDVAMSEIYWEIYTPGATTDTTFDLPTLPGTAPRAADGGLFDPLVLPGAHRWTALSFRAGLDPSFDYNNFSFGAMDNDTTHVSLNFVEY